MKKHCWLTVLVLLVMAAGSIMAAQAEVIPPYGEGQIGLQAVVLCEQLTMRGNPDTSANAVRVLPYGSRINLPYGRQLQSGGWAYCVLGDSEDSDAGWVKADYLMIDPAWYRTDRNTPVYAWNDTAAPKVALLDRDEMLPVLKEDGNWLLVSLRGAVGWIRKGAAD